MFFSRFDSDEDGVVSCKEVGKILRNLGYNPSDAELQVQYWVGKSFGTWDIILVILNSSYSIGLGNPLELGIYS